MNCGDFEKLIPQLAGWGLIEAGTQAAALRHAETCAHCAARLADERLLLSGVRAVRAELANEEAPARIQETLLNAFRERSRTVRTPVASMPEASVLVSLPQRSKVWMNWKVAAIAAVILLATSVGAIVFVRSLRSAETPPSQVNVLPSTPNSAAPTPKANDEGDQVVQAPTPRRRAKPRSRHTETVTEYFPLIAGDDLDSLEFTQVVRVELTPAALREVGLPSSYATEGDFVKADLVLGHDGIARAIRFVR